MSATQPAVGLKSYNKLQIGRETPVCGVEAAATTQFRGVNLIPVREDEVVIPEEDVGNFLGYDRSFIPKRLAQMTIDEIPYDYDQINLILNSCLSGVTGVLDVGGTGQIRTYPFEPLLATPDIFTYTFRVGDNVEDTESKVQKALYCFAPDFNINGEIEGPLNMSCNFLGQRWVNGIFTPAIALPTNPEEALFGKTALYIDNVGGTIGTTQVVKSFLSFDLDVTAYVKEQFTGDGNDVVFAFVKRGVPELKLQITLEIDAVSLGERDNYDNQVPRAVRIINEGSALGTPGAIYTNHTAIFDCIGKWTEVSQDTDNNNNRITFTMMIRNNAEYGNAGQIITVNEINTVEQPGT